MVGPDPVREIEWAWGPKPDRPGHAILSDGGSPVGHIGGQVKQVARCEIPTRLGTELSEDFQRGPIEQGGLKPGCDLPSPLATGLHEKDIIGIDMGTNASVRSGHADHQIIKPRLGNKSKGVEKQISLGHQGVDLLHEHRPA